MNKLITLLCIPTLVFASSIESVIKKAEPKVVQLEITKSDGEGVCSGAFVTDTGIILTCAHCFSGKVKRVIIVTSTGRRFPAQPLLISKIRDLAVIAPLNYQGKFPYFKLGKEVRIGQQVISLGSPLGMQHTATVGWINNIVKQKVYTYLWHSAFINPGNSGGPLINMEGKLVGVNQAMIRYDFFQVAQGIYVAISLKTIREIWHG